MKFTYKEIVVYAIIAIIIIVAVSTLASGLLNPTISVSVKIESLNGVPPQLYPYQVAQLRIIVNNTGKTPISNLVVGTYLNGQQLLNNSKTVSLPPGTNTEFNVTYIYRQPGAYEFEAIADPGHLLMLQNRSVATGAFSTYVSQPSLPNVYTSVPNGNITTSQTFSITTLGLDQSLFIATQFSNQTIFNNMVDSRNPMILRVFEDLSSYIVAMNGASTIYNNGSASYVAWTQGLANLSIVSSILSSFHLTEQTSQINGQEVLYIKLSNNTSMCSEYSGGWTKFIDYYNISGSSQNCMTLASTTYNSSESIKFINALHSDPNLQLYVNRFVYVNSTPLGTSLIDNGNSLAVLNMSGSKFGFFTGYIKRNRPPLNLSAINNTCVGSIFMANGVNVCSYSVFPVNASNYLSYRLINSTENKANYTVRLFSLVGRNLTTLAYGAAPSLMGYLNVAGNASIWKSIYKSQCSFTGISPTITCNVISFNASSNSTVIAINNPYGGLMKIQKFSCYIPGVISNLTFNQSTLSPGQTAQFKLKCQGYIPGIFNELPEYNLQLNYTLGGALVVVNGTMLASPYG
ncbi:MAG: CARDB domain-containing protein [Candidatus Micrarchaeales archaeon]